MRKVAFVTGGSRGIGRAVVRHLAAEGCAVGIDYLQARDQALALERELREQGFECLAVQGDVSDREAVTAAIRQVEEAFGPVSVLVNNAGIAGQRQFQDLTDLDWRRFFAVNLDGAFYAIQAVLPHMLHEKRGAIVNVSSIWGLRGASCEVAYSASKAALIGLTRSLAMELAPSNIRVNCVAPGVIHTDMVEVLGAETLADLADQTHGPAGHAGGGGRRRGLPGRGRRRLHHRAGPHRRRRVYPVGAWGCMRRTSFSLKRKGSKETFYSETTFRWDLIETEMKNKRTHKQNGVLR